MHTCAGREASAAQESIQQASINGHMLNATAVAEFRQALDADAAPSVRADVLARGTLCFTYVCRHPVHVCTRHFVLDLSRGDDGAVAAALCVWASAVPGEAIVSQHLDGCSLGATTHDRPPSPCTLYPVPCRREPAPRWALARSSNLPTYPPTHPPTHLPTHPPTYLPTCLQRGLRTAD